MDTVDRARTWIVKEMAKIDAIMQCARNLDLTFVKENAMEAMDLNTLAVYTESLLTDIRGLDDMISGIVYDFGVVYDDAKTHPNTTELLTTLHTIFLHFTTLRETLHHIAAHAATLPEAITACIAEPVS
jgi:hypothetical protein